MLLKLGWRNLWRNRRRTIITVVAIGFSLALTTFFIAFGEGLYAQMIGDAVRLNGGHFTLEHPSYRDAPAVDLVVKDVSDWRARLESTNGVASTKALVLGQAVVKSAQGAGGVAVMGVEPEREQTTSPLARRIVAGRYLLTDDDNKVIIGKTLAERLKVDVGKKLVLTANDARGELIEELVRIVGIFSLGSEEADAYMVQVPINFSRRLYAIGTDEATQLGALIGDDSTAERDEIMTRVRSSGAASVAVLPWEEVLPDLSTYVQMDRSSNIVFMAILVFLSMFTIYNTLSMTVVERTRELAALMALGTTPGRLRLQLLAETAILGLLACAAGLSVGGAAAYWMQLVGLDLTSIYGKEMAISGFAVDPVVHAKITWTMMGQIGGSVFVATLGLGVIAMRRIGRIDIASVLR